MVLIQRSRTQLKSDLKMGSCFMTKNGKFIFSRKTKSFFCLASWYNMLKITIITVFLTRFHKGTGVVVETRENGRYR